MSWPLSRAVGTERTVTYWGHLTGQINKKSRKAIALVGVALATACGDRRGDLAAALARMRAGCVVVVLDAAAAGHFGAYGYDRGTTPNIDAFAAQGIVFTRTYSQGPGTIISVPSYFSGLYPQTIARWREVGEGAHPLALLAPGPGIAKSAPLQKAELAARPRFLAEAFRTAGFRTAGFSENPWVSPPFSLDAGFEHFVELDPVAGGLASSHQVVDHALTWLGSNRDARFFVYLQLMRPHDPYLPPPSIAERFRPRSYGGSLRPDSSTLTAINRGLRAISPMDQEFIVSQYDANLFYGDELFGELIRGLRTLGLFDRTVLIVMADHGEAFGEHGRFLHSSTVYEEMIRVPLILRLPPSVAPRPRRVSVPVALLDLFPTLGYLFSLPGEAVTGAEGLSLAPLIENPNAAWPRTVIFAQRYTSVAAIEPEYKYIAEMSAAPGAPPEREELYFLPTDPGERRNIVALHPERVRAMRESVAGFIGGKALPRDGGAAAESITSDKRRQLRALGYLQ